MNALDIVFLIPLLLFAWRGFSNGLVKEIVRIVGYMLAAFISFNHMDMVLPYLKDLGINAAILPFVASLVLFSLCSILVELVSRLLNKLIDVTLLTVPNKLLGALFGSLKIALFFSFTFIFLAGFNIPDKNAIKASVTYPVLIKVVPTTFDVISTVYPGAEDFVQTLQKRLPEPNADALKKYLDQN